MRLRHDRPFSTATTTPNPTATAGDTAFSPAAATATVSSFPPATDLERRGKKRGNYNCGRCGLPKKGHSCFPSSPSPHPTAPFFPSPPPASPPALLSPPPPPPAATSAAKHHQHQRSHLLHYRRRALAFDESATAALAEADLGGVKLPAALMMQILRRLPPLALLAAAQVCKGWRDCARLIWSAGEELRISIGRCSGSFLSSVLQKCPDLVRLSLRIESDVDATVLAYTAFACPNLEALEIRIADSAVNRITGDELGRFVTESRCLSTIKIEGCTNLGFLNLCSSSLSTLWLSDLHSVTKMSFNCPNLKELSLDFSREGHDSTDLCNMVENLGRTCPRLRSINIACIRLSHTFVLALTSANLRALRMLSLVLGSEITDASVAAIAASYTNLELLDLTGSSISDSGIGIICNVFPRTLSRLLLALCPNITLSNHLSGGIQFAAAQLPLLQLIDCGMAILDPLSQNAVLEENGLHTENSGHEHKCQQKILHHKLHPTCQKLIIKHTRLKKLSLWGCSGLDALYLNCPELNDLNLNSCTNLHPEKLLLQCPSLEIVHASGCQNMLVGAIHSQVFNDLAAEDHFPSKRLADGSKRVQVPRFAIQQPCDDEKGKTAWSPRCVVRAG